MKTALDYWEDELKDLASGTRNHYRRYFNNFIERYGLTAEELFTLQNNARKSDDPREANDVEKLVRGYMRELIEEGKAPGTARNVLKAVSSFLAANSLTLKVRKKPPNIYNGSRIIREDQIRLAYNEHVSSEFRERNRALIMFLKDSGLRVSDVAELNVEDYEAARIVRNEAGEPFKVFTPRRSVKTGHIAHVHIGPEAIKNVDRHLDGRESGPLFLNRSGERLTGRSMTSLLMRICGPLKEMGFKVSAHSFRKFHRTKLESEMALDWIKKLQGKAASEYSHPEGKTLTEAYIEAYEQLRVFTSEVKKDAERVKEDAERDRRIKDLEEFREAYFASVKREKAVRAERNLLRDIVNGTGEPATATLLKPTVSPEGTITIKASDIARVVKEELERLRDRESEGRKT